MICVNGGVFMLRKHILTLTFALLLTLPGCNAEPTVPATQAAPTVQTTPSTTVTVPTEPSVPAEPTWPDNKMFQQFDLDGMKIRLPKSFQRNTSYDTMVLETWYSYIIVTREPLKSHPDLPGMTLEQYAQTRRDMANPDAKLHLVDGILCYEYELPVADGAVYYHWVTFFKSETDFWIIQFVCDNREADKYQIQFLQWAKTIEFAKAEQSVV
jgi:hypothetical protein